MKLLSVVIPCYNSQEYMRNCIESLLPGREDVELLIVNDGSVDGTAEIADDYARKYPSIVKVIHQPNGGHGEAVNTGLRNATGLYFKVVDSDDWVDIRAYLKILDTLRELTEEKSVDMLIERVQKGVNFS
ncbi:glycosyltransferase family 2 protein [Anaerobacillus isosaccharinicus]|uniref:Glycosyltransferase family 2 protein n=1 Tax=Anaerobacillus isosaccharinicus TaxID=1532552 RepID=A0AC62A439_9BACI|nr:glycosyltransferase family A protein [Anaerobacillus isosaccharinicus]